MKDLVTFVEQIDGFLGKSVSFKIECFAWYLHEVQMKDRFEAIEIGPCFDGTHVPRPGNVHAALKGLCDRKPARLIRDAKGYRLSAASRIEMTRLLPVRASSVKTTMLLNTLLDRISDPAQKTFLNETLVCFKHHAYRAAIVMAWNLAFHDVLDRIFDSHLTSFNEQLAKTFPKEKLVVNRSDFEDLKESRIIEIGRGAGIFGATTAKRLKEKLDKRNTAAHPSTGIVLPVTADEVISDLVENVILSATW